MLDFVLNFLFHNRWIISIEEVWSSHPGENLVTKCAVELQRTVAVVFMKLLYFFNFF